MDDPRHDGPAARAAGALRGAVLFTPGDRPERFDKGWAASGGRLILDLEDAVSPERKSAAREAVARWLHASGCRPLVRLNAIHSPWFDADCAALAGLDLAGVVVPKTHEAADLDTVRQRLANAPLYPLIESPRGLASAVDIARAPGVAQLLLGALDLHSECGVRFAHPALLERARLDLMLASRVAGIAAPVDSPHPAVKTLDEVADDASAAARLGFAAKLCIHPAQLNAVDRAFRPSADEIAWAREVLAAAGSQAASGAVQVHGQMVDAPVLASARAVLARAG